MAIVSKPSRASVEAPVRRRSCRRQGTSGADSLHLLSPDPPIVLRPLGSPFRHHHRVQAGDTRSKGIGGRR